MRGDAEGAFAAITVAAVTAVIAAFAATAAFSAPAGASFVAAAIPECWTSSRRSSWRRVLLASRTWAKLRNALTEDRKEVPLEGEGHYEGRATRWQAEPPPSLRRNGLTPARRCSRRSHRARASAGWARGALRGCRYSRTSRSRACQVDVVWIGCGSGAEGAVFVRACARVSRGVLAVRLASGSRPAPIPEWSAQVAARTTCTTEKDCPSCLRPSCRPDRNSRSQTACAGWPAHAWREVGGR